MPNRNRTLIATFASIAVGCAIIAIIAGIILVTFTSSATSQLACALGDQQSCETINTIATIRLLAFIALVSCALLAGAFGILAIVFAALGPRSANEAGYYLPPMPAPPSTPLYQQPLPYAAPLSSPLYPTPQPPLGSYDAPQDEVSGELTKATSPHSTRPLRPADGPYGSAPPALLLSVLGATIVLAVIGGLVLYSAVGAAGGLTQLPFSVSATPTPSPTATPQPTPTDIPTPTPILSYSAPTPGPGCGSPGWTGATSQSAGDVQCTSSGLLMKSAANANSLTSVFWNGVGSPSSYAARVTVSKLSSACGGIGFQNGYRAYIGYVCSSGAWSVIRYDSSGAPTRLDSGSVAQQSLYLIDISVAGGSVEFHVGATTVFTGTIASDYDTGSITLALEGLYQGQAGQGHFSDFVYGR